MASLTYRKRWKLALMGIGVSLGLVLFNPDMGHAVRQNKVDDPAPNTASIEIEKAIAKGKELVGVTDYWWGGGHGGIDTSDYQGYPPRLDCSSFVHWAYNKGAGMKLTDTVHTTRSYKQTYKDYVITGVSQEEAQRGDLVYLNGGTHVVIWLGDGVFIGCQGSPRNGGVDRTGGVQITTTKGWKWDGVVIRLTKDAKGVSEGDMEPLKDPNSVTGSVASRGGGGSVGGGGTFEAFDPFIEVKTASAVKGVQRGDEVISQEMTVTTNYWVQQIYKGLLIAALVLAALLVTYTSVSAIWYFALLPKNGAGGMEKFEKFTGIAAVHSSAASMDLLLRWVLSISLIGFLASKAYVAIMAGMYELLNGLFS